MEGSKGLNAKQGWLIDIKQVDNITLLELYNLFCTKKFSTEVDKDNSSCIIHRITYRISKDGTLKTANFFNGKIKNSKPISKAIEKVLAIGLSFA